MKSRKIVSMPTQEQYFIVNTNSRYMPKIYKEMLKEKKAAAYYNRKEKISKIRKGNIVFLYHNRVGVIAYGRTNDSYKKKEIDGDEDEEYYIPLKFSWKINPDTEPDKAVKFSEICSRLRKPPIFDQAVFPINKKIAKVIMQLANRK